MPTTNEVMYEAWEAYKGLGPKIADLCSTIERLDEENDRLLDLAEQMYRTMQRVLLHAHDTVWVGEVATLRDEMDVYMQDMASLGISPDDYEDRCEALGIEELHGR